MWNFLFLGGAAPPCNLDAGDFDDDGALTVTDAYNIGNYLFGGGGPPAPPYPDPGCDISEDDLDICSSPPIGGTDQLEVTYVQADPQVDEFSWDDNFFNDGGIGHTTAVSIGSKNFQQDDCVKGETVTSWKLTWFVNDLVGITTRGAKCCQRVSATIRNYIWSAVQTPCNCFPFSRYNWLRVEHGGNRFRALWRNPLTGTDVLFSSLGTFSRVLDVMYTHGNQTCASTEDFTCVTCPAGQQGPPPWTTPNFVIDNFTDKVSGEQNCDRWLLSKIIYGGTSPGIDYIWTHGSITTDDLAWDEENPLIHFGEIITWDGSVNFSYWLSSLKYVFGEL